MKMPGENAVDWSSRGERERVCELIVGRVLKENPQTTGSRRGERVTTGRSRKKKIAGWRQGGRKG